MLYGIGGLIALAVGFFIGLGGLLAPLALFLGIVGIVKEKSIAAWLSAIGGFIGFAVILITKAGAENTVINFFVSLWNFLELCFTILFVILGAIALVIYSIYSVYNYFAQGKFRNEMNELRNRNKGCLLFCGVIGVISTIFSVIMFGCVLNID